MNAIFNRAKICLNNFLSFIVMYQIIKWIQLGCVRDSSIGIRHRFFIGNMHKTSTYIIDMLLQLIPLGYTDNNTKDKWLLKSISKSQQQLTCIIQPINSAANKTTSLYRNVYGLRKKIWYPTGNCLLECQKIIVKDIKYMYRFPNKKLFTYDFILKL